MHPGSEGGTNGGNVISLCVHTVCLNEGGRQIKPIYCFVMGFYII